MEMLKTTCNLLINETQTASFTMKELCILNIEKQSAPQVIMRSGHFESTDTALRKESLDI